MAARESLSKAREKPSSSVGSSPQAPHDAVPFQLEAPNWWQSGSGSCGSSSAPSSNLPTRAGPARPSPGKWSGLSGAMVDSSSESSQSLSYGGKAQAKPRGRGRGRVRQPSDSPTNFPWEEVPFADVIRPSAHQAHCQEDIRLLGAFLEQAGVREIDANAIKLLFRTQMFLRLCDYCTEDICCLLAHASSYFSIVDTLCGSNMDASEVGNVIATLAFIAHCYILDEICPLRVWHRYLFRKYCELRTLNSAVMKLLELLRYSLRLEDDDLRKRLSALLDALPKPFFQEQNQHSRRASSSSVASAWGYSAPLAQDMATARSTGSTMHPLSSDRSSTSMMLPK